MSEKYRRTVRFLLIVMAGSIVALFFIFILAGVPKMIRGEKPWYPQNQSEFLITESFDINKLNEISIDTSSDDVVIVPTTDDKIYLTYKGVIQSNRDDEKANIKFEIVNSRLNITTVINPTIGFVIYDRDATMIIEIPTGVLDKIIVDTSSGLVDIRDVDVKKLNIGTSSGYVTMTNFKCDYLFVDTSSGDVTLNGGQISSDGVVETSSGEIGSEVLSVNEMRIDTTSGKSFLKEFDGNLEHESSSGDLFVEFSIMPRSIESDTSSGNVEIKIPANTSFNLNFDTSSGSYVSDFPISLTGEIDEDHIVGKVGESENSIYISTSSGDLILVEEN